MIKVTVKVPATTANIGPGFDCMGLALSLWSEFVFEPAGKLVIEGCPAEYANEDNLVWQAFKCVYDKVGEVPPGVKIQINAEVPVARGLGSSSTCLVAGVLAANVFLGNRLDHQELFQILNALEGHPDNVAPALFGGLCASFVSEGEAKSLPYDINARWHFIAVIPNYEVSTHEARRLLKPTVPFADAVFNISHALATAKALEKGSASLLSAACEDRLHEPFRATLIPDYEKVREIAKANGAATLFISGSGSTLMAVADSDEVAQKVLKALREEYPQFKVLPLQAADGATVQVKA